MPAAALGIIIGTKFGETPRSPRSRNDSQFSWSVIRPPTPVPMITATRSGSHPVSVRLGAPPGRPPRPRTGRSGRCAARRADPCSARRRMPSAREIPSTMPDSPAASESKNASAPSPSEVTTPRPVTATLTPRPPSFASESVRRTASPTPAIDFSSPSAILTSKRSSSAVTSSTSSSESMSRSRHSVSIVASAAPGTFSCASSSRTPSRTASSVTSAIVRAPFCMGMGLVCPSTRRPPRPRRSRRRTRPCRRSRRARGVRRPARRRAPAGSMRPTCWRSTRR